VRGRHVCNLLPLQLAVRHQMFLGFGFQPHGSVWLGKREYHNNQPGSCPRSICCVASESKRRDAQNMERHKVLQSVALRGILNKNNQPAGW